MTHYFIDDQWNLIKDPQSVDEISKLANEYQDRYFPDPKPTISIQVTNSPQFYGADVRRARTDLFGGRSAMERSYRDHRKPEEAGPAKKAPLCSASSDIHHDCAV